MGLPQNALSLFSCENNRQHQITGSYLKQPVQFFTGS